jgi:hypothetical protein
MVTTSHETISVYFECYEQGHRRDRFQVCEESRYQGHLPGCAWKSIILAFGKMLELENGR